MSRLTRVLNLLRRRAVDREFEDELRFHIIQRIQQNIREGMAQVDAEADAHTRFGNRERVKADMRAQRIVQWFDPPFRGRTVAALGVAAALIAVFVSGRIGAGVEPPRVYEMGGRVSPPVPLYTSQAEYTLAARAAKVQGVVRVRCVVRLSGDCSDIAIVQSPDPAFGLDEQAMHAVRRWRFRPGSVDGNAVPIRVQLEFAFALR